MTAGATTALTFRKLKQIATKVIEHRKKMLHRTVCTALVFEFYLVHVFSFVSIKSSDWL